MANLTGKEIFERAVKDLEDGNIDDAEIGFNFLYDRDRSSSELLFYLSTCSMKREFWGLTEKLLNDCLKINDKNPAAWNNLGYIYKEALKDDEAVECFEKAISLCPDDADMYNNIGGMFVNNGTPNEAIAYFDKCLEHDQNHASGHWNKGLALLEKGSWHDGWTEYEWGFKGKEKRKNKQYPMDLPFWDGKAGQTVIVYGEQGIGDEIMFASIIGELSKEVEVIYDCHPRLADIFRNSFDFPIYGTRKDNKITWPHQYNPDAKVSVASLGKYYRNKDSDFPGSPYLKADESLRKHYREKLDSLGSKMKVGISWKGGYKVTRKDLRSIPLEGLSDVLSEDCTFISLQYTPGAAEDCEGTDVHHWQEAVDDYDHTAALVAELDLVISVCTSVIHLSGALGTPCWVMTPSRPAWRYGLESESMIWYDSVKLYRQEGYDWGSVVNKIKDDLCHLSQKIIAA